VKSFPNIKEDTDSRYNIFIDGSIHGSGIGNSLNRLLEI
jgi:hypothetical protein